MRSGLVALAILLSGCHAAPPSPAPEPLTVTLAVRADVTEFFPNGSQNDSYTGGINTSLYEGLVGLDAQLRLRPALAERWESPDERTYVFTLRPDLRFSDGSPLRAQDVVASLQAVTERQWETRDYLRELLSVRALSEREIELHTRGVALGFLTRLPWAYVLPARAVVQTPVPVIGTGPFVVESRTVGQEFVLRRNPHYRGPQPAFERARFVVVPDPAERVKMVERGAADLADDVSPRLARHQLGRGDLRVVSGLGPQTLFLALRPDRPPFTDARVREAFDLTIDRGELIRRALDDGGVPASQLVTAGILGHNPKLAPTEVDRPRARKLLAAAGLQGGLKVRLDAPNDRYPADRAIAAEVARQLAEVGVEVQVNTTPKKRFFEQIDAGDSAFHLLGWTCLSGDAGDVLDALLHSRTADGWGLWNTLGLADLALDRLIEQSALSTTDSMRSAKLQAALARVGQLHVTLPLVTPHETFVVSNRLEWTPPLDTALRPAEMRPAGFTRAPVPEQD